MDIATGVAIGVLLPLLVSTFTYKQKTHMTVNTTVPNCFNYYRRNVTVLPMLKTDIITTFHHHYIIFGNKAAEVK